MVRARICLAISALLLLGALPGVAAARSTGLIRGAEVGYFGGATVTRTVSVFVYSDLGPSAGNRVTVCLAGKCERARGHDAKLAWYSASFRTRGYRMGDRVTFTVTASDGSRRDTVRATHDLLCMHNNGSTPQG